MPEKLTKEIVNERLKDRGIQLIGEYLRVHTKAEFECKYGHKWSATPSSVIHNSGCPECSDSRLSKDIVNQRLLNDDRDIRQIGEYITTKTKTDFQCNYGHIWKAAPYTIMRGNNCPKCTADRIRLSKEIVNARISHRGIIQIGEYTRNKIRTEFQCKCGHIWKTTPNRIMSGDGCPVCADYGFNPGKPAWIYILTFDTFIKYGITNNLNSRFYKHTKSGQYTVALTKLYEDGSIALNWEKNIKIIFGGRYVTKEIMPDGYTETLSPDKLEALLDTIK